MDSPGAWDPLKTVMTERLGVIRGAQIQAALDRAGLGRLVNVAVAPGGSFGQNLFLTTSDARLVLRGAPHFAWQFPVERFAVDRIHALTTVPVPWPYRIDDKTDIFGWNYVLMPHLDGLHPSEIIASLPRADQHHLARVLGDALAQIHTVTWSHPGRYDAASESVLPLRLAHEVAWPFTPEPADAATDRVTRLSELITAKVEAALAASRNARTDAITATDVSWVTELLNRHAPALDEVYAPCLVLQDYKGTNILVTRSETQMWSVSGVFDFMETYFGDGDADLVRMIAELEDPELVLNFVRGYASRRPLRDGFGDRLRVYMLNDRLILWSFFQRHRNGEWSPRESLRSWAGRYLDVVSTVADRLSESA